MSDPTRFTIPRRRLAIAPYVAAPVADNPAYRDAGIINGGELVMEREPNEYRATDLASGACREYVADANTTTATGTLTIEMMGHDAENLGVLMESLVTAESAQPGITEQCENAVVGSLFQTASLPDPSTFSIEDSTGTPLVLTEGTDWEWVSKKSGLVRILNLGSYVQPFKLKYDSLASSSISPMSLLNRDWTLLLSGGNERNSCGGEFELFYKSRLADAQTIRRHEPFDVKTSISTTVGFIVDRDPSRNYEFGPWRMAA